MFLGLLLFIISIYLFLSIIGTLKVKNAITLDENQKRSNILLLWVLPFIWYWVVIAFLKRNPGSFEVPDKKEENTFYESGNGAPGAGIKNR